MSEIAPPPRATTVPKLRNRVLFTLLVIAFFAMARGGFLVVAPNRLATGHVIALWDGPAAGTACIVGLLAILAAACFIAENRRVLIATLVVTALMLIATLLIAADMSASLAQNAAPVARRSLGPAFWILIVTAALAIIDTVQRLRATILATTAIAVGIMVAIIAIAASGAFDSLSLAREFVSHRELLIMAIQRHIELVAVALIMAIFCGTPLIIILLRRPKARAPVFALLNLLQTIPSIALFGLLLGPLTFAAAQIPLLGSLGIGGIGAAPAIIALMLYSLLPLVRSATAGLAGVDPAVIDSARGMGMTQRELFLQVRFPLALPALVSALRIVTIQAIGLATVAALIGAGGLGDFVFQGIGQYALDLVLLGALPIVFLALAADLFFQIWLASLRRSS